jgi:hypothetical protein
LKKHSKNILIKKASGEKVPFSAPKLIQSLMRAGADEAVAESVVAQILPSLYSGISTRNIYKWAFNLLQGHSKQLAGKYRLKRAIMELGPSGYPFEKFISEILKYQGYTTTVGKVVKGRCVDHEIDVIAEKGAEHWMIECKYHNRPGTICDVKIPLYIHARFQDVEAEWVKRPGHADKIHRGWVVTNTRFTGDAIRYGNCAGLKLLGWDYPEHGSLKEQIDTHGLYPITCLNTLLPEEKQKLLDMKIVLCREICDDSHVLLRAGVEPSKIAAVQKEGRLLCESTISHPA